MTQNDPWARWLLENRFGGDEDRLQDVLAGLIPVREKVLAHAALAGDETLLDVGCGDGLIAFGALAQLPAGRVIFADISQELLDAAHGLAKSAGLLDRCQFIRTDAMLLDGIADASVDVVTTRSVLIYVPGKRLAFEAFYRVLKPGGTFSLFEPIHRFAQPEPDTRLWGYDVTPVQAIATKVKTVYAERQPSERDPLLNFDATDLVNLAESAGFREIHLELYADITPIRAYNLQRDWQTFLHTRPNPRLPSLHDAMQVALSPDEQTALEAHLRPLVEAGDGIHRQAVAYVWGEK